MDGSVKFSILVPVYKVEKYIDECISSVLAQTYPHFELILVDDGSPDRCGEICEEYAAKDERIKVFHKPNGGLMSARRRGISEASGDYYIFLDSDDYIAADSLEILERNVRKTGADCIIYGIEWRKLNGTEYIRCRDEYSNRLITDKAQVLNIVMNDPSYNSLCRKCVKASCFDGRDFSPYYHISSGEDRLQSLEILENAASFLFIPDMLYYYRANFSSVTHSISYDNYKADFTVGKLCLELVDRLDVFEKSDYDRMRNFALDSLSIELKRISRFCSGREHMLRAFDAIRDNSYYKSFLSPGYSKAPVLPGIIEKSGLRRLFNRILIFALKHRCDSFIIFFSRHIYK